MSKRAQAQLPSTWRPSDGTEPAGCSGVVDDQRVRHAEHRVTVEVAVAAGEDVRDQSAMARRGDHEVQVRRPPRLRPAARRNARPRSGH